CPSCSGMLRYSPNVVDRSASPLLEGSTELTKKESLERGATAPYVEVSAFEAGEYPILLAIDPAGKVCAAAGAENTYIWRFDDNVTRPLKTGYARAGVSLSADGRLLAINNENNIDIWSTEDLTRRCTLTGHAAKVNALAFSPVNSNLLVSSQDYGKEA